MIGHRFQYTKLATQTSRVSVSHPARDTSRDGAIALLLAPDFTGYGYAVLAASPRPEECLVGMVGLDALPDPAVLGFVEPYRHCAEAVDGWKVLTDVTTHTAVLLGHLADLAPRTLPAEHPMLAADIQDAKVLPFQARRRSRGLWRTDDRA